jgi:hypothetical protein
MAFSSQHAKSLGQYLNQIEDSGFSSAAFASNSALILIKIEYFSSQSRFSLQNCLYKVLSSSLAFCKK